MCRIFIHVGLTIFNLAHIILTSTTQELKMTKQFTKLLSLEIIKVIDKHFI